MTKKGLGISAVVSGGLGTLYGIDPVSFMQHVSAVANNQIAQAGFFFTLAAFIHSGRVKTEIKSAFLTLTDSLNQLGNTLSQQLHEHSEKLDAHQKKLDALSTTVTELQLKGPTQTN